MSLRLSGSGSSMVAPVRICSMYPSAKLATMAAIFLGVSFLFASCQRGDEYVEYQGEKFKTKTTFASLAVELSPDEVARAAKAVINATVSTGPLDRAGMMTAVSEIQFPLSGRSGFGSVSLSDGSLLHLHALELPREDDGIIKERYLVFRELAGEYRLVDDFIWTAKEGGDAFPPVSVRFEGGHAKYYDAKQKLLIEHDVDFGIKR